MGPLASVDEDLAHILDCPPTVAASERVPTAAALGRVRVEDLIAGVDVPPTDNSAVDGYAVCSRDLGRTTSTLLEISQRAVLHHHQGLGALTSTVCSEGLAVIPEGATVAAGDTVEFLPNTGLLG